MKKILILLLIVSYLFSSEYLEWLQNQTSEFISYKKSLDDEFSDILKKEWEAFDSNIEKKHYIQPKPASIPVAKKVTKIPQQEIEKSKKVVVPKKIVLKEIVKPIKKIVKPVVYNPNFENTIINFYNQKIAITYDKDFHFTLNNLSKNSISNSWKHLSKTDFKQLISQVENYSEIYALNDWAKYLLLYNIGQKIYGNNTNKINIFTWFVLVKMGYDTKIGYSQDTVYLLSLVKQDLYQIAFFNLGNKKYFVLTPNGRIDSIGSIYTYKGDYPNHLNKLSFDMSKKAINLNSNVVAKRFNFTMNQQPYQFNINYSKDLISFYKNFPQSEYKLYFQSQVSNSLRDTLLVKLRPFVENKTEIEAVNFLLSFVQTSFKYKTDAEQFKHEKVLFPEETIHYAYSDCEDRSILFSYLVTNLLGLETVGLKYKDHLSTAVVFSTNISGDSFTFNNKKYIITDPTYLNAKAGMSMPKYKRKEFDLIQFN